MRGHYSTDIERVMRDLLVLLGLEFVEQYPVRCKYGYICDFFIPSHNLIIECDGDRWHSPERDNPKTHVLLRLGYRIVRFKGSEILHNYDFVKERLVLLTKTN